MKTFSIVLTDDTVTSLQVIADLRGNTVGDLIMEAVKKLSLSRKETSIGPPIVSMHS